MFGLFASLKHRSEAALRSAILVAGAGGLVVLALGFAAGAMVLLLAETMPLWGALLAAAGALTLVALLFFLAARRPASPPASPPAAASIAALAGLAATSGSLKDLVLRLAEQEARTNPAAAAAIAAAAGLLLGALEGRNERRDAAADAPDA